MTSFEHIQKTKQKVKKKQQLTFGGSGGDDGE